MIHDANTWLTQTWTTYLPLIIGGGVVAGVLLLIAVLVISKRTTWSPEPLLITLGTNLALLFNAKGMWDIVVDRLHQPRDFAVLVFAVFEVTMCILMRQARRRYTETTKRDEQTGKVKTPGNPGMFAGLVWAIAVVSGLIVATNAKSLTEALLRIALPIMVVAVWHVILTAEGATSKPGVFRYSPRRLAVRWGLITSAKGGDDLDKLDLDRRRDAMVRHSYHLEQQSWGQWWHKRRLRLLALKADEQLAAAAAKQVAIAVDIVNLVSPAARAEAAAKQAKEAQAEAAAELDRLREEQQIREAAADAEQARQMQLAELARQAAADQAAAELQRTEVARRVAAEQQAAELRRAELARQAAEAQAAAEVRRAELARQAAELAQRAAADQAAAEEARRERVAAELRHAEMLQRQASLDAAARAAAPVRPRTATQDAGNVKPIKRGAVSDRDKLERIFDATREKCSSWDDVRKGAVSLNEINRRSQIRKETISDLLKRPGYAEQLLPWPAADRRPNLTAAAS